MPASCGVSLGSASRAGPTVRAIAMAGLELIILQSGS